MVTELPPIDFFKVTYTVLGGLGIFFFGMRNMSDGLQAIGGKAILDPPSSCDLNFSCRDATVPLLNKLSKPFSPSAAKAFHAVTRQFPY